VKKVSREWAALLAAATLSILLAGCSSSGSADSPTTPEREAGILGSRLCILNDTGKTIPMIRERGPFKNADHHADPAGPLAPGATWCTNGYNSFNADWIQDATADILFTADGSDHVFWGVDNSWAAPAEISWGRELYGFLNHFSPEGIEWETDLTYPQDALVEHRYHIRRLDDSEFFKEWLVTVRS
jgi:hypothetical protein